MHDAAARNVRQGGGADTEEKERGGASQDAATRFGAQSRMRR